MDFQFNCGEIVSLTKFDQSLTYEGLLEGVPTREINNRIIDRVVSLVKEKFDIKKVKLIPPVEKELPENSAEDNVFGDEYFELPKVICSAKFEGVDERGYTELAVVWLQDEFCFNENSVVVEEVKKIKWLTNADVHSFDRAF